MKRALTLMLGLAVPIGIQAQNTPPPLVRVPPPLPGDAQPGQEIIPGQTRLFSNTGAWSIVIDETLGGGCFILASFVRGTAFRVGFNQTSGTGYILLGNENWHSLQLGQHIPLELQLDDGVPWRATAGTMQFPNIDVRYLTITFTRPEFLAQLAASRGLRITTNQRPVATLDLAGAADAVRELVRCQRANPASDYDPFDPNHDRDPFAPQG